MSEITPAIQSDIATISVTTVITNMDEFNALNMELAKFKDKLKEVNADEKSITAPINRSLKEIRDKYRPVKERLEQAITTMRNILNEYKRVEDAKREQDRLALEELSKDGTASLSDLIELADEAPSLGGRLTTIVKANPAMLTENYVRQLIKYCWEPVMIQIRKDVAAGLVEQGVTVTKEKRL